MTVSVIIPCFNAAEHLHRCINSLLVQEYRISEIICVDDGSTDSTHEILLDIAGKHPSLIKIINQQNGGACKARNTGLNSATSDYIQFLDADDCLLPSKIRKQMELVAASPEVELIAGNYIRIVNGSEERIEVYRKDPWIALIRGRLGCTCSNLFLRSALMKVNGWKESLKSSQEADLMFRLLSLGLKVGYDEQFSTQVYVQTSGSISTVNMATNLERYIEIRKEIFLWLKEKGHLTDERNRELGAFILGSLRMLFAHDKALAIHVHNDLFAPNFEAVDSPQNSKPFIMMYKLLGFASAQGLMKRLRK